MKTLMDTLTSAARDNVRETGINPIEDLESLRTGETEASLLARCLDGADADRVQGWTDYVTAVVAYDAADEARMQGEAEAAGH